MMWQRLSQVDSAVKLIDNDFFSVDAKNISLVVLRRFTLEAFKTKKDVKTPSYDLPNLDHALKHVAILLLPQFPRA
jgi:O-phosphoseryl-tRNA(Cys) synthetase